MDKLLDVLVLVISVCVCLTMPKGEAMAVEVPKQILIFGGNGFIGSATAERLLSGNHSLTLVNRGNWYWDSYYNIKPYVRHIRCDRFQEKCQEFDDYVASVTKIDVVIDFSGYDPECVKRTLKTLEGKVQLYVYISTDSVYEVCEKNGDEPTKESDAIRPKPKEGTEQPEYDVYQDAYGDHKLKCEEVLVHHRKDKFGPRYVILRLPDVFGPRDNTQRWWIYQMWIKMHAYLDKEVAVPKSLINTPISLVYVDDVADMIVGIINSDSEETLDHAYNLAQKETLTLMNVLEGIREELNLTDVDISVSDKPDTLRLYPSVRKGPIDSTKAQQELNWNPTPWKTALRETVKFYDSAMVKVHFDRPRQQIIRKMQTYFTSKPYNVIRALRDLYHLNYPEPKDEL